MGRGNKSEIDLNLPAFVHLSSASMSAGGPGAVGYTNQVSTNDIQSMYKHAMLHNDSSCLFVSAAQDNE